MVWDSIWPIWLIIPRNQKKKTNPFPSLATFNTERHIVSFVWSASRLVRTHFPLPEHDNIGIMTTRTQLLIVNIMFHLLIQLWIFMTWSTLFVHQSTCHSCNCSTFHAWHVVSFVTLLNFHLMKLWSVVYMHGGFNIFIVTCDYLL